MTTKSAFKYISLLESKIDSPYSSASIVRSTSGNILKVTGTNYTEFKLDKQYAGKHIQVVLRNTSLESGKYSFGISNKLTLNSALAIGVVSGFETKVLLMPCPLNFDTLSYSASPSVEIIGLHVVTADFEKELKLLTPESFVILDLLSRNYISSTKEITLGSSFLLSEGNFACKTGAQYNKDARLSLQITSKKVNIYIGTDAFLINGAATFCVDIPAQEMDIVITPYSLTSIVPSLIWNEQKHTGYVLPNIPIWTLENHAERN
jgi:hypothetical protein